MIEESYKSLKYFISMSKKSLPIEALEAIMHYFEHDEFELCFEGLVIELINNQSYPERFNFLEWKKVALEYQLDKESAFDGYFWGRFTKWGESYPCK
ncbi:hypothetical protein [Cytobacillus horneckiae]|uniref:hypothetical protein n=1 Tax=Cytobacillus horneckiae TaxID=549687 RepID=UPI003D9A4DC7